MDLAIHLAIIIGIYIILAVSLNLALGYTGLINLGHVAFFAVGAYASAILTKAGMPFAVAFFLAALIASMFGLFLTRLTSRLQGDYLALATLAFSYVIGSVLLNWQSLTRGPFGIPGLIKPQLFGWRGDTNWEYLIFTVIVTGLVVWLVQRVTDSRYGRLLQAVRDDAIGAAALGKPVGRLKYQAMMISAGLAGIAGSLFAHYLTYIHPSNFFLADIVLMLSIVIVGGLASWRGSVISAVLLILLTESLRFIHLPAAIVGPLRLIIYALLLLLILLLRPRGLLGRVDLE